MISPMLKDLPMDLESEKNLIWCLLRKPELLRDETLSFSIGDFHFSPHRRIIQVLLDLDSDGMIPDPGMISGRLGDQGDRDYLFELRDEMWAHPANAHHYVEKLREVAIKRQAIFDADKLFRAARLGPEDVAKVRVEIKKRRVECESDVDRIVAIDATNLVSVPPREHIIQNLIPRGIAIALHGPPGIGKSVFLTKMTVAVASGQPFYGMATFPGRVMYISNEWADDDEVCRIWYEKTRHIVADRIDLVRSGPLLEWVSVDVGGRRKNVWEFTRRGSQILRRLEHTNPDLIILDTVLGLCLGVEQLNNSMTYALGDLLQKEIGTRFGAALIAVAHTSQSSSKESLDQRLHYEAMAGGNGLPGALRMAIGLTKVRPTDFGTEVLGLSRSFVAVGSSKFNVEGFRPLWTNNKPGYFSWGQTGLEYDPTPYSAIIGGVEPAEARKEKAVLKGGKNETYF